MRSLKDILIELVKAHSQVNADSIFNRNSSTTKGPKMQDILGFDDKGQETLDDTEETTIDTILKQDDPQFATIENVEEKDEEE